MKMIQTILVYLHHNQSQLEPVSLELIGKADEICHIQKQRGYHYQVCAAAINADSHTLANQLIGYPVQKLFCYQMNLLYNTTIYSECLRRLCLYMEPEILLMGANQEGRSLAPYLAACLQIGLTADCTELRIEENGDLIQIRPAFEETRYAHIRTRTRPQMATIRPGMMQMPKRCHSGSSLEPIIYEETIAIPADSYKILARYPEPKVEGKSIAEAKILVALGGGIRCQEDVAVLGGWAKRLGGQLACSRKLVERGWFPQSQQIGLSGQAVQAELLIAIGISGSVQFQAGIRNVKRIVAINKDENAPILPIAEFPILLDCASLLQELTR